MKPLKRRVLVPQNQIWLRKPWVGGGSLSGKGEAPLHTREYAGVRDEHMPASVTEWVKLCLRK
jgi:hypothetical protein